MATFEIDASNESLILHIKGLQVTLRECNLTIETLKARKPFPALREEERQAAYKEGWEQCYYEISTEAQIAINSTDKLKNAVFENYMVKERNGFK